MCQLLIFLFLFFTSLQAGETKSKEVAQKSISILPSGEIHEGDYFTAGSTVEISGKVTGDVYAIASLVVVDGEIEGDLLVIAGNVHISGVVAQNVRILAGQCTISGKVGRNATIVSANAELIPASSIQGNLVSVAGNVDLAGHVSQDATVVASNLRISSSIEKNIHAYIGHMRLTSKAFIGGDLEYDSDEPASIEPQAQVSGKIIYHPSFIHEILKGQFLNFLLIGSKIAGVLMNFLYTLVIGWIWLKVYPQNLAHALQALSHKPIKAFAYGVMLLILLPLVSLVLLVSILGAPFALTLLALNVIGFYTAKVLTIFWASNRLFKKIGLKPNTMPTFCLGLFCYFLLTAIPFFGSLLAFIAMIFGLGATPLARIHYPKQQPLSD
jgi:cytoskeletal protein CcmA (bactofilin family)